jgi:hypothetical protein
LERISKVPWQYDSANHEAYYHRPIGVAFFVNGLHSGAVGILKREGRLPATEIDLGPLYAAGFGIEWQGGVPLAVFGDKVVPMDHPQPRPAPGPGGGVPPTRREPVEGGRRPGRPGLPYTPRVEDLEDLMKRVPEEEEED